jgi:hypothetical protein
MQQVLTMHVKLGEDDVDTAADTADYADARLCRFSRCLLSFYMRINLYAHYFTSASVYMRIALLGADCCRHAHTVAYGTKFV